MYSHSQNNTYSKSAYSKQSRKYEKVFLPPSSIKQLIQYFASNNFQDFNGWQQTAKSKLDLTFTQNIFRCHILLSFDDNELPIFSVTSQGRNKKDSKKKALQKLISEIAEKGYIALGFKQSNFMEKIQNRKKDFGKLRDEPIADDEDKQKRYETLFKLVRNGETDQAIQYLCKDLLNLKTLDSRQVVSVIWFDLLCKADLNAMTQFIRRLHGDTSTFPLTFNTYSGNCYEMISKEYNFQRNIILNIYQKFDSNNLRYFTPVRYPKETFQTIKFNGPFEIDLDDLFKLEKIDLDFIIQKQVNFQDQYVIKKKRKIEIVADPIPVPLIVPTYKKNHLLAPKDIDLKNIIPGMPLPLIPQPMLPMMGVHPMLAPQFVKQKYIHSESTKPFLVQPSAFTFKIPSFQQSITPTKYFISAKLLQALYDCLFFFEDFKYCLKIAQLIYSLCKVNLQSQQNSDYYTNRKNQLVCQFIQNIHFSLQNSQNICLSGTANKVFNKNKQEVIHFTPSKFENIDSKLSRKNFNQYQQMFTISKGQYVKLFVQQKYYIAYLKQSSPIILVCPWIKIEENFACSISKITNKRIYEKISDSLVQVAQNIDIFKSQNVQLFWELPGTSRSFLLQTVLQWSQKQYSVLIVSTNIQQLSQDLSAFGIKYLKLTHKIDQKFINNMTTKIVVASITSSCADCLKSLIFTHVLIDQAHQISQHMCLMPISKGCNQLVMIGDFQKNPPFLFSKLAASKGMGVSLFQRLSNNGNAILCYNNQRKIHPSISSYISTHFYNNVLKSIQKQNMFPTIKGFRWPCQQIRICLVNIVNKIQNNIDIHQAQIIVQIIANILKAGYTNLNQMSVIVSNQYQRALIIQFIQKALKILPKNPDQKVPLPHEIITCFASIQNIQKDLVMLVWSNAFNEQHSDPRLLNVAMSKAIKGFILVGDLVQMGKQRYFRDIIQFSNKNNLIYKV